MPLSRHPWFLLVTVVAIAWAQTAGIHRGYLCDCGGKVELTMADHCHGPHTLDCHEETACTDDHHGEEHPADEREHPPVIDSLIARQHQATKITVALPDSSFAESYEWLSVEVLKPRDRPSPGLIALHWPPWSGGVSDWPHRLSQTIELRI